MLRKNRSYEEKNALQLIHRKSRKQQCVAEHSSHDQFQRAIGFNRQKNKLRASIRLATGALRGSATRYGSQKLIIYPDTDSHPLAVESSVRRKLEETLPVPPRQEPAEVPARVEAEMLRQVKEKFSVSGRSERVTLPCTLSFPSPGGSERCGGSSESWGAPKAWHVRPRSSRRNRASFPGPTLVLEGHSRWRSRRG